MKIPITKPFFDECEKENIVKPLETGWLVQGPFVAKFEALFAEFVGANFALATTNCTTALQLSLEALNITYGDSVVVPSFTYVATANAVESTGAEVVFCDIDLKTFNIDTRELGNILKADVEKKIKAIIPVNLFGLCSDLEKIVDLSIKYGISIVEDSACGFGALIKGKHSGTFGDLGCFSFHPRKAITTGEGGMVVSDNKDLIKQVSILRDHGASKSDLQRHKGASGSLLPEFNVRGFNYRMTDIQGAVGVCQIKKADYILEKRKEIAARYETELAEIEELETPYIPAGYMSGYQSYVCLFSTGRSIDKLTKQTIDELNVKRNEFMMNLEKKGISVRQGTHAVHTLGYYRNKYDISETQFLHSYAADRLSIAFPLYANMKEDEFNYVIRNLKELL